MKKNLKKILDGYKVFKEKYARGDDSAMKTLWEEGQSPKIMVVACCDSRVDPAVLLQCDPGDLFVVRNVANIIPPYEKDKSHHGTSAALEFGICFLKIEHLIILGHSQCGGIQALLNQKKLAQDDFISSWVSLVENKTMESLSPDAFAKKALHRSFEHALEFPWIKEKLDKKKLTIHQWFFEIKSGTISEYCSKEKAYKEL